MCSKPKTARRWRAGRAVTFVLQLWWRCVTRRQPAEPTLPLPAAGCSGWRGVRSNVLEHSGVWSTLLLDRGSRTLSAPRDRRAGSILKRDKPIIKHNICSIFTCDIILGMKSRVFRMTHKPEHTDKNHFSETYSIESNLRCNHCLILDMYSNKWCFLNPCAGYWAKWGSKSIHYAT